MNELLYLLKHIGNASLSLFWFPLVLWTIVGLLVLILMKYSLRIHAIYQYHSRVALLLALPVGVFASFLFSKLSALLSAGEEITAKLIVIQSPITVSETAVGQYISWSDPMLWTGITVAILSLIAAAKLGKMTVDFIALGRLSKTLDKQPLPTLADVSPSNRKLANACKTIPLIAFSDVIQVPFTFGWIKSTVVFPRQMKADSVKFNLALRHELMHIKHRDYLLNNLLILIKSVFWFHPLVHYLYASFKEYREISCDSEVLADPSVSRKKYAELLYELAPRQVFQNNRAVSMAVNPSTLKKRIQVMITQNYSNNVSRNSIKLSLLSMLLIAGIIACSDMQSSGITNQDVAEVQRNIPTTKAGEQPLYIVNGEVMNLQETGDIISRIKPEYIENIKVLKGDKAVDVHGEAGKNGVIEIQLLDKEKAFNDLLPAPPSVTQQNNEQDYFLVVEEMPELIGGLASLQEYIKYPEEARNAGIEGRVIIQFIVSEQGQVEDPKIIRGIGGGADEVALEAVKRAEFKPGIQRGEPVRVQYSLPIVFRLPGGDTIQKESPTSYVETPKVEGKNFAISHISNEEPGVVTGVIKDAETENPIKGAHIIVEGLNTGVSTDSYGRFRLKNVPNGNQKLHISYVGYYNAITHLHVK